ncbi:MAG: hypothetical protein V4772_17035 [Pseudomonadota bacterium]
MAARQTNGDGNTPSSHQTICSENRATHQLNRKLGIRACIHIAIDHAN